MQTTADRPHSRTPTHEFQPWHVPTAPWRRPWPKIHAERRSRFPIPCTARELALGAAMRRANANYRGALRIAICSVELVHTQAHASRLQRQGEGCATCLHCIPAFSCPLQNPGRSLIRDLIRDPFRRTPHHTNTTARAAHLGTPHNPSSPSAQPSNPQI